MDKILTPYRNGGVKTPSFLTGFTFIKKFLKMSLKTFDPKKSFVMSSHGKLKIILAITLLIVLILIIAGYLFYLYQKGGVGNYRPPVTGAKSPKAQVLNDLTALSQAIDAYYAKNLKYPEKLEELQPEFIDKIPLEPKTGKPFIYESDGKDQYQIGIPDPASYGLKELFIKNGKVHQN